MSRPAATPKRQRLLIDADAHEPAASDMRIVLFRSRWITTRGMTRAEDMVSKRSNISNTSNTSNIKRPPEVAKLVRVPLENDD